MLPIPSLFLHHPVFIERCTISQHRLRKQGSTRGTCPPSRLFCILGSCTCAPLLKQPASVYVKFRQTQLLTLSIALPLAGSPSSYSPQRSTITCSAKSQKHSTRISRSIMDSTRTHGCSVTTLPLRGCGDEIERVKDRFYKTSSEISSRGTIKSSERSITFFSERSRRVK